MRNRGYITVFLALLISGLLMLFAAIYTLTGVSNAKGRAAAAMRSAMSSVRAEYNRYLFDQYHMLLLDSDPEGEGQGKLEALAEQRLKQNLGEEYEVSEVELTGVTAFMGNDLEEFHKQMEDACLYIAADIGLDYILSEVKDVDTPVTQDMFDEADEAADGGKLDGDGDLEALAGDFSEEDGESLLTAAQKHSHEDPRTATRAVKMMGVADLIAPEDMELSDTVLDPTELPSFGHWGILDYAVDADFDSYSQLKRDATRGGGWMEGLVDGGASLLYAGSCFNCLTGEIQEDTVLRLEMEYLIAGKTTDEENYRAAVNQLTGLRFGCNFAYILTDGEKMGICLEVATVTCAIFPPLIPVVKYLIAGGWAYMEAVADAYRLVRGKKVPFMKDRSTWVTSLSSEAFYEEVFSEEDSGKGLTYKQYLIILLATQTSVTDYRMLDIMELNANHQSGSEEYEFHMKDAITAFGMAAKLEYNGHEIQLDEEIGY